MAGDDKLLPDMDGMEETIYHLPVIGIRAEAHRGWWDVRVQCERMGPWYSGKKDRSYFSALAKALDEAMVRTGHREKG